MLLIPYDFSYAVGSDKTAYGILHADDTPIDCRLNRAVFKGQVAILGGAILQNEIFAVAQGLCSLDMATDKAKIFGIPSKILAFKDGIIDGDVLCVPECVLGLEIAVFDLCVFYVLKRILPFHIQFFYPHITALKKLILGFKSAILDIKSTATPRKLLGHDITTSQSYIFALAESLDTVKSAILKQNIPVIPQGGTAGRCHTAVLYFGTRNVPKRIAQHKIAVIYDDISALLYGTLAIGRTVKCAILNGCVLDIVECALFIES